MTITHTSRLTGDNCRAHRQEDDEASEIQRLHAEAMARDDEMYRDPRSGLWVMTSTALRERGWCCNRECRHCPWTDEEREEQRRIKK